MIFFLSLLTGILLNLPSVDLSQHYKSIVQATVDALDMSLSGAIESALDGHHHAEDVRFSLTNGSSMLTEKDSIFFNFGTS